MGEPKSGDDLWWRGMRMVITAVDRGKVRFQSKEARVARGGRERPAYHVVARLDDLKWHGDLSHWYMEGVEGELPKFRAGPSGEAVLIDPPLPRCRCRNGEHGHADPCATITFRQGPMCSPCRLADRGAP